MQHICNNYSLSQSSVSLTVLLVLETVNSDMIGRGSSSVVLQGIHRPTGIPIALKVINMFDKSKRDQLIREICILYNSECPALISFYGAFYREGSITIALEYMVYSFS